MFTLQAPLVRVGFLQLALCSFNWPYVRSIGPNTCNDHNKNSLIRGFLSYWSTIWTKVCRNVFPNYFTYSYSRIWLIERNFNLYRKQKLHCVTFAPITGELKADQLAYNIASPVHKMLFVTGHIKQFVRFPSVFAYLCIFIVNWEN